MLPGADKAVLGVLQAFKALLLTDDATWLTLLDGHSPAEITAYRNDFRSHPPTPKLGYPRSTDPWPVWCVVLLGETLDADLTAASVGEYKDSNGVMREVLGFVLSQKIGVFVYADNPDTCRTNTLLVKAAILGGRDAIQSAGLEGALYAGCEDLAPDTRYLPEHLWARGQYWEIPGMQTTAVSMPSDSVGAPIEVGIEGEVLDDDGNTGLMVPATDPNW